MVFLFYYRTKRAKGQPRISGSSGTIPPVGHSMVWKPFTSGGPGTPVPVHSTQSDEEVSICLKRSRPVP